MGIITPIAHRLTLNVMIFLTAIENCCGGRTRTTDLLGMSQMSCHCSTPR